MEIKPLHRPILGMTSSTSRICGASALAPSCASPAGTKSEGERSLIYNKDVKHNKSVVASLA